MTTNPPQRSRDFMGQPVQRLPEELFTEADVQQIRSRGLSESQVLRQLQHFQRPAFFADLARPCTLGDGIRRISENEQAGFLKLHEQAADRGRFLKFVPASGAASRMFQVPSYYFCQCETLSLEEISRAAAEGDPGARSFVTFCECLHHFAFFDDLRTVMWEAGLDLHGLTAEGRYREILEHLLTEAGLGYLSLPKGLLKFHAYESFSRTPFEEHLVEAAFYARDREGRCRLHFTILPEHQKRFQDLLAHKQPVLEELLNCRFQVDFSFQSRATDTIAADMENRPCRDEQGRLLFWPGGHGALLTNLACLDGDLVYIKNIDNVVPDRLKEPTVLWKRIMGGFLAALQEKVHGYLERLSSGPEDRRLVAEVREFAETELLVSFPDFYQTLPLSQQRDFLVQRLNRPMRVCGVVKNEGEPGGAPFWVREQDGSLSLQIVETAQVNLDLPAQRDIWASSTHFNPVDLVLGLRDFRGRAFNLQEFMNPDAVFISRKSKDGRKFKVLELPGLWNGSMAHWLTVFVEVPLITFNPVKTVLDLLRPEHQP
ncbi:MAG: DUF4301 family protein [Deltaproteobacteria bacterium]|nr:DUF4301 family protein [Deltaproteobacteria bacterium]